MSRLKRRSKRKLAGKDRLKDARRWPRHRLTREELVESYTKRYGISAEIAELELMQLGCGDEIKMECYDKAGLEWEYRIEPLSGEMMVVPADTEDHVLFGQQTDLQ